MTTSLVLRVCRPDFTSYGGFKWPSDIGAEVSAPDWKNNESCGNGLHGWLYGKGTYTSTNYWEYPDAKWMVLEVCSADLVILDGKCKFHSAIVRFVGTAADAATYLLKHEPNATTGSVIGECVTTGDCGTATAGDCGTATAGECGTATAGQRGTATAGECGTATAGECGTATAGDCGTATAGDYGTATAGQRGTATAGDYGTATAGDYGTATAGGYGTATAGYRGTATAGECGTATAGECGTATAGQRGTATAGECGTATAGDYGTATAGDYGTATAGECGTASAGEGGEIRIRWFDRDARRYRTKIGYVGEDGIKPDTSYRLNQKHEFEKD